MGQSAHLSLGKKPSLSDLHLFLGIISLSLAIKLVKFKVNEDRLCVLCDIGSRLI